MANDRIGGPPLPSWRIGISPEEETSDPPQLTSGPDWAVDLLPAIVWTTDAQLIITSTGGRELSASEAGGEAIGWPLSRFWEIDDPHALPLTAHHRALRGQSARYEHVRKGRRYLCSVAPATGDAGNIVGCVGIAISLDSDSRAWTLGALRHRTTPLPWRWPLRPRPLPTRAKRTRRVAARRRACRAYHGLAEQHRQQARLLDAALSGSFDFVSIFDRRGRYVYVCPASRKVLEPEVGEVVGRTYRDLGFPPEVVQPFHAEIQRVIADAQPLRNQRDWPTPEGLFCIEYQLTPILDRAGQTAMVLATARDQTRRRHIERQLQQSQERLELAMWSSDLGLWDWNVQTSRVVFDVRWAAMSGYTLDQLEPSTETWQRLVHPDDQPIRQAALVAHLAGATPFYQADFRLRCHSGEWGWFRDRGKVSERDRAGRPLRVTGTQTDLREQKAAEAALEASRNDLARVVASAPIILFSIDQDGNVRVAEGRALEALGYVTERAVGRNFFELDLLEGYPTIIANMRRGLAGESFSDVVEFQDRVFEVHHKPLRSEGRVLGVTGIAIDTTERVRAEQALRESERRFRLLAQHSTDVITHHGADAGILFASMACETVLGYTDEEMKRITPLELFHPDDIGTVLRGVMAVDSGHDVYSVTARVRRKDGSYVWLESTGSILRDPQTGAVREVINHARDISERVDAERRQRQLEGELAHVVRVSTLGEMASGIAHELNQPLAAIAHYAFVARRATSELPPDAARPLGDLLDRLEEQALRAGEIVRRMRDFVRKTAPLRVATQINALVRQVEGLIQPDARLHGVRIMLDLADDLPTIVVDGVQIQQVIVNLVRNAFEALEDVPRNDRLVTIRTALAASDAVEVAVLDRGKGLPQGPSDRIFDPFFSTKPMGIGMGLAISRSIISAHGGKLTGCSDAEQGTVFRFELPSHHAGLVGGEIADDQ